MVSKNESCQNYVLTIPLCKGGRGDATGENGVKIRRRTWPHALTRSGEVAVHARRRAPRIFFALIG